MKRTTIFVTETLERDLQLFAAREGRPAAAIVRDAIAAFIHAPAAALPSFTGAFDSGHTDTAERHDEILFGRLDPHAGEPRETPVPPRRSKSKARTRRPGHR
jgi:hypothetical protein